jgi:hypothetical protein
MKKQTLKQAMYLAKTGEDRELALAANVLTGCPAGGKVNMSKQTRARSHPQAYPHHQVAERYRGTRTISCTEWPVIDKVERVAERKWLVLRGLCNGVADSAATYATRREALEAFGSPAIRSAETTFTVTFRARGARESRHVRVRQTSRLAALERAIVRRWGANAHYSVDGFGLAQVTVPSPETNSHRVVFRGTVDVD